MRRFAIVASLATSLPITVVAQTAVPPSVLVRVHVADSIGVPVPDAQLVIRRSLTNIVASAQTDGRGDATLSIPRAGIENDLVVRKIGFVRAERFFNDTAGSPRFEIRLTRTAQALDTVRVAEREDPVHKSYFIDAEQIENSPRYLFDALDIVTKLRPDMVLGRQGRPDGIGTHGSKVVDARGNVHLTPGRSPANARGLVAQGQKYGYCQAAQYIWVNGNWIRDVQPRADAVMRLSSAVPLAAGIAGVLASIKPEHVAEMHYVPCAAKGADSTAHSTNAIYVELKPGIAYSPGLGSYVAADVLFSKRPAPSLVINRLLGVFDDATGDALENVDVVDVATGTKIKTTKTGTVGLGFLSAGDHDLRVEKSGFAAQTLTVHISPVDSVPITIILGRAGEGRP